jgi:hypothetical protein
VRSSKFDARHRGVIWRNKGVSKQGYKMAILAKACRGGVLKRDCGGHESCFTSIAQQYQDECR